MSNRAIRGLLAMAGMLAVGGTAISSPVTLYGTDFDVTYDPTTLPTQFGTLNLVGDTLFFTTNNFSASSTNGAGVVPADHTASGIILTANQGFNFGALSLAEFGDYTLQGAASTVNVSGQLRAFDYNNSFATQSTSTITPTGALTTQGTQPINWSASARIDDSTVPVANPIGPTASAGWLANATQVDVTIENLLTAYSSSGTGPQSAFIEKKFDGIALTVTPVPLPAALWLFLSGGGILGLAKRHRRRSI